MGKTYKQVLALVFITIILSGLRFLSLDDGFTLIKKNKNVVSNGIVSTSFETRLKTIIKTEYSEPQIIEIQFAKYLYDNQSAIFIDSRDSIEFNDRHIKNAINISYEDEYCSSIEDLNKSEIFVIYCSGFECDLSLELAEYLVYDEDFKKILVFEEGLQGWLENEFPTENGEIIRYPETNSYKNYIMIILYSLIIFIGLIYFYFPRLRNKGFHLNKFTIQICRLVLGVLFIYASLDKIINPVEFSDLIDNYHFTPVILNNLIALFIPWIEMILGLCLVFGVFLEGVTVLTIALYGFFILLIFQAVIRGIDVHCGCFSVTGLNENTNFQLELIKRIFEDLLLLGMAIIVWISTSSKNKG